MKLGRWWRRLVVAAAIGLLLVVLSAAGAWVWADRSMRKAHAGWAGTSVDVELAPGTPATRMVRQLGQAGVLRHPRVVTLWLRWRGGAGQLQAGEYRFDEAITPRQVLQRLRDGDVLLHPVTFPEGLVLEEVAAILAEAGFGDLETLESAFRDPQPVRHLIPDAQDLEGFLFPDTYHFRRGATVEEVRSAMLRRFEQVVVPEIREGAKAVGLTLTEAVTLASLIEKETGVSSERRRVSRVFHNRLERGMRLQCDPTTRYAWHRLGRPVERLTYAHLELESPWNTYHAFGLPPTPIASPGEASLRAAVNPTSGDELYFVAAPGGGHTFSQTLADHNRAVAVWRRHQRSRGS